MKRDGTRAETRFCFRAKRTSPFKSARERQVSRLLAAEVCGISGSNAGYTMFRGGAKSTGYPLNSPVSRSLPLLCVSVCQHISKGVCIKYLVYIPVLAATFAASFRVHLHPLNKKILRRLFGK